MPIGKNALKRVTNNGYSAVKATAPDMENSVIVTEAPATEAPAPEVKELTTVATVKAAPKKNTAPKTKKATQKPKTEGAAARPDGFVRFGLGQDLPEYLL